VPAFNSTKRRAPSPTRAYPKRKVNGTIIGSKRNNVNIIRRKRLQKLLDEQVELDRLLPKAPTKAKSGVSFQPIFMIPTPKMAARRIPMPIQDANDDKKPTEPPLRHSHPPQKYVG